MRLDHLLSKEMSSREKVTVEIFRTENFVLIIRPNLRSRFEDCFTVEFSIRELKISGGDAIRGHTRLHPEHDG